MIRKLVLGAFAHWQLVGLLGFAIALMCFVHARRTVERGWCSVRFGGRATRIDQPFAFWSEVYLSYLVCLGSVAFGLYCTWWLTT